MHRLLALLAIVAATPLSGGTTPPPSSHRGTAEIPGLIPRIDRVLIVYAGKKAALVTEPDWIAELRRILTAAEYRPSDYCFCSNTPQFILFAGETPLTRFEVPHSAKLRFLSEKVSGDFAIGDDAASAILAFARRAEPDAKPFEDPRERRPPPKKVKLEP